MGWEQDSLIRQQRKNTTTTNDNKNDKNKYAKQTIYNTVFSPPDDQFAASRNHGTQKSWIR